jgi:diguanylate cyclase (GGDEF)-like protein
VCRLGGDEFAILCEHVGDADGAAALAQRLDRQVNAPMDACGSEVCVFVSVGIVTATSAPEGPEQLLRRADEAMYEAKRRRKRSDETG